jgi:hypothetical protein
MQPNRQGMACKGLDASRPPALSANATAFSSARTASGAFSPTSEPPAVHSVNQLTHALEKVRYNPNPRVQ